jgi:hypothetical protein
MGDEVESHPVLQDISVDGIAADRFNFVEELFEHLSVVVIVVICFVVFGEIFFEHLVETGEAADLFDYFNIAH